MDLQITILWQLFNKVILQPLRTLSLPDFCLKELRTIRFPAALMQIGGKEYNINLLKF
jgi:hypothetical protein